MIRGLLGLLLLAALGVAGFFGWQYQQLQAFAVAPVAVASELVVEIPAGTGPRGVSTRLVEAGAVTNDEDFYRYVRFLKKAAGQLKAGSYRFTPDEPQSPEQIVERLLKGEVLSARITLPEGLRLDEQATLFEQAGFGKADAFVKKARDATFARSLGVPADTLEGYLFPDTYLIPQNATVEQILRMQVERFERAWQEATKQRRPEVTLDKHQAVTLASIVEKETGQPFERPRISCVFHNRLRKDMKLQTDPTVIYSVILRTGSFDGNLRRSDLRAPHPYNTYSVKGLPPGPIASAGQAALEAALAPIDCEDLFFVSRNDGSHVFCPDLRCHNAAVQKWQIEYFRKKRAEQRKK